MAVAVVGVLKESDCDGTKKSTTECCTMNAMQSDHGRGSVNEVKSACTVNT